MNQIKVLLLAANPRNTDRLALDQEIREIAAELERSKLRDQFDLISKGAVRVEDLSRALLQHEPTIVHFSGHGAGEQGLALEDNQGQLKLVPTTALIELFRLHRTAVKCVFLNACYSEVQADAIYQQIDCVIGMNKAIGDKTAIQFAPKFYAALAQGRSFQDAFDYAKNVLQLDSNPELNTPIQKIRQSATNLFPTPPAISTDRNSEGATKSSPPASPRSESEPRSSHSSIGNISSTGNNNAFNVIQGDRNTISQSINHSMTSSTEIENALAAIAQLMESIANTDALNDFEKEETEFRIQKLEAELQKTEHNKGLMNQIIAALKKSLDGVAVLAEPVAKLINSVAKV
jgi:hypothetical protein